MTVTDPLAAAEVLTDPVAGLEVVRAALAAADLELVASRLDSVHHRVGRSRSVLWSTTVRDGDGRPHDLAVVTHVDRREVPDGPVTVTLTDGTPVAVWRFPNDPFLPGLPSATSPARVRELLDDLHAEPGDVGLAIRAYRPARRAVVEVTVDGPRAGRVLYLKVLAGRRAERLGRVHRELAEVAPVPEVVGVAATQGILAIRALPGRTLRSAVVDDVALPAPDVLVRLSEDLARAPLSDGGDPSRFADPTRHVDSLGELLPDLRPQLEEVAEVVRAVGGPRATVHGDLHEAQLLVEGGELVGVLDVDGAGTGWLAQDAGSLVAHLEVLGEVWPHADRRATRYADEVARAYARLVDPRDLARGAAGAWLGLATGPYRVQDAGWERFTRIRVAKAAAWAARASG